MQSSAKLVALILLCALTGCSSFFSKSEGKNAPAALLDFKPNMLVKSVWSVSVGGAANYVFSPAYVAQDVYAAAADGTLVRIDASSGRAVWRINAGMRLTAGVGANDTTVAVAGDKGFILAFDADGKLRWKAQASSEILSAPAVGQGLVVVRSTDNKIAAYDAETGVRKWSVERPLPVLTLRTIPGITIAEQMALVALPGGRMAAFALNNGGVRWEANVGEPKGATELERVADVSGTPVVIGREVCASAYQGRVGCYDLASGALRWAKNFSSEVGVSADERFVFAADNGGAVSAYSRSAGASVWRNDKLAFRHLSAPASFGRAVAVGDLAGYVHFLSREDGSFIGRVGTDGSQILATPIVAGSNLIVQTKSGSVVALATE
ncbi:MAG: outer membrane protein assembly factor BamB [Burkholderiales bacterium]|nr:outer membrane protein assembly factor BamB [Burkholderiales bacterium]